MRQRELRELNPGTPGGLELARQRGRDHMAAIGQLGGLATLLKRGRDYLAALARAGAAARWARARQPHTVRWTDSLGYEVEERHVFYKPARSRARKPRRVIIWQEVEHDS